MKDTIVKILLFGVIGLISIQFIYNIFFTNSNLKKATEELKSIKTDLSKASTQIDAAKTQTDSLKAQLDRYAVFISNIQDNVKVLELQRRANAAKFGNEKKEINERIEDLIAKIDTTQQIDIPIK